MKTVYLNMKTIHPNVDLTHAAMKTTRFDIDSHRPNACVPCR